MQPRWAERVLDMKGKFYFAAGAVVGLLTGSRLGRGLYDRTAKAAGAVAGNTTVRQGVTSAGERAVDAAKSAGGGLGHKVTELRRHVADRHDGDDETLEEDLVGGSSMADVAGGHAGGNRVGGSHMDGSRAGGRSDRAPSGSLNGSVGSPGPLIY